jgi:hypothetical protein
MSLNKQTFISLLLATLPYQTINETIDYDPGIHI